jgi:hypothetical protein
MSNSGIKISITNGKGFIIDEFDGRWLGFIKDADANAVLNNVDDLLRRSYTSASLPMEALDKLSSHRSERLLIANTHRRVLHISPPVLYMIYKYRSRIINCEGAYKYQLSEINSGKIV